MRRKSDRMDTEELREIEERANAEYPRVCGGIDCCGTICIHTAYSIIRMVREIRLLKADILNKNANKTQIEPISDSGGSL